MTPRTHAIGSRVSAVLAAMAVAGCTVGPDYVRPEVATELAAVRILADRCAQVVNVYLAMGGGRVEVAESMTVP